MGTGRRIDRGCEAIVLFALAGLAPWSASAANALDRYLEGLATLDATFAQTLVDGRGRTVQQATGRLIVQRPGRFRWELRPSGAAADGGQLLVADGRNVWFLDRDLEQVTVRPAASALTATPAMLLSGGADVRAAFEFADLGARDGLAWVRVAPRGNDADFRDAEFGFERGVLKRLVLRDKLGQVATLEFRDITRNGRVAPEDVRFTIPPGADVIGTPAS
jgi:chaperone LolA